VVRGHGRPERAADGRRRHAHAGSATNGPTLGTEAAGTLYSFTMPAATMVASKTYAWEAIG
jgi:hypothetical protein